MKRLPVLIGLGAVLTACPRKASDGTFTVDRDPVDVADADTDADSDADADADGDADSDADADADTDADADADGLDTGASGFGIVINEILADPDGADANCDGSGDDVADEFVEIVNTGSTTIDLSGATLSDFTGVKHTFGANTVLEPAGAVIVFGGGAPVFDGSSSGIGSWCVDLPRSVILDVASAGLGLNDGGDTVTLTGPLGVILDSENYAAEGGDEQSVNRNPEMRVNNMVHHRSVPGAVNAFSPGTLANQADFSTTPPIIETGDTGIDVPEDYTGLVINEIMADPGTADSNCDGLSDSADDEYVEIVNILSIAVDLGGVELHDASGAQHTFPGGTSIDAGGTIVVFGGGTAVFPGVGVEPWCQALPPEVTVQVTTGLSFNNDGDDISLVDPTGATITSYSYGTEGGSDESLIRSPEYSTAAMVQHTTVSAWVASPGLRHDGAPNDPLSPIVVETGDTGVPPGPGVNDTGDPGFGVVINELLADAGGLDANCDGLQDNTDEEFVEIVNTGTIPLQLGGATLSDASVQHTFDAGTVVPAGGAIVVFGGGTPVFAGGGDPWCEPLPPDVEVVIASSGDLSVNNGGETFTLTGPGGAVIGTATYGASPSAESVNRNPELDPAAPIEDHTAVPGANRPFSPGTRVDGGPLSSTPSGDTGTEPTDTGTAPAINDTGAAGFGFVLNEILADPGTTAGDANCDGVIDSSDDEFVEIVNPGTVPLILGGGTISDANGVQHTFDAGTVIAPRGAIVVFGGGTPAFGGPSTDPWCGALAPDVQVIVSPGGLSINNDPETLTVTGPAGFVLGTHTHGSEGNSDESLTRDPDGDPTAPMVQHTTLPGGATWSPGTRADGSTF